MNPSADQMIEALQCAVEENQIDPFRQDQTIHLPPEGELWIAGDMHDHRRNFDKFLRASDLGNNRQRHIILQELIHGDHYDADGAEESWLTLYHAAELKCDFPEQVHFLLANHDLAQVHGRGIMKAGLSVCEAFTKGVKKAFEGRHNVVNAAITEFLMSFPLAARSTTGLFFCHSLPTDSQIEAFDFTIFDRPLDGADYAQRSGPVYQLIWGRNMAPPTVEVFAEKVGARILVTGHQPQEMGYGVNGDRHLIIASDHNHGVFLPVNLAEEYTLDDLVGRLQQFVALDI